MKWFLCVSLFCVFFLMVTSAGKAGDAQAGKAKASTCVACHGKAGVSTMSTSPNLAGQKEQYLISALKGYRDGTRDNPMMTPLMKSWSDEDIENLASYYSSLNCN